MAGSGHVGARCSAARWNASPDVVSSGATTTKSSLSLVTDWSSRRDQKAASDRGSGQS
jgi:hypothetical protein